MNSDGRLFNIKRDAITTEQQRIHHIWIRPQTTSAKLAGQIRQQELSREYRASELLCRPKLIMNY